MFDENMDEHELVNAFSRQTISFNGCSDFGSHEVHGKEVAIDVGPGAHKAGSSKLLTDVVINFTFDNKYYIGSQLALDYTGTYFAYALGLDGDCPGAVRVLAVKKNLRGLVRSIRGPVKDLDFSSTTSCLLLAVVDAYGHLYVYNITRGADRLILKPFLTVTRDHIFEASEYHRVVWCAYLSETVRPKVDENGERVLSDEPVLNGDISTMLLLTHDADVEVWDTRAVSSRFGPGPTNYQDLMKRMNQARLDAANAAEQYVGYKKVAGHEKPVIQAVFMPDGGVIATASQDGYVRFFEIDIDSDPRLLHEFMPHEGRPLSCLYFLDNLREISDDVKLWRYAVTGADYNREIKLWCCGGFTCLQTINFRPPHSLDSWFKVEVDATGKYVVLSDIHRRMLYVMLFHDAEDPSCSQFASISEFPLALPFLSLKVKEAGRRKVKRGSTDDVAEAAVDAASFSTSHDEIILNGTCGGDGGHKKKVFVEILAVQPKGIQKCTMLFDPHSSIPDGGSTSSFPTFSLDDSLVQDNPAELSGACFGDMLDYDDQAPVFVNGPTKPEVADAVFEDPSILVKSELVEIKQEPEPEPEPEPEQEPEPELSALVEDAQRDVAASSSEVSPGLVSFDSGAPNQGLNNESLITPPQPKEINKIKNIGEFPDQQPSSSSSDAEDERPTPGAEAWVGSRPVSQGLDETLKSLKDILKELKDEKKAERNRKEALRQDINELRAEVNNLGALVNSRPGATVDVRVTESIADLQSTLRGVSKKVEEVQKSLSRGLSKRDLDAIAAAVAKSAADQAQIRNIVSTACDSTRQSLRNDFKKELQGVSNMVKKMVDLTSQPGQVSDVQARTIGNSLAAPVHKYLDHAVAGAFAPVLERMVKQVDKSFKELGAAVGSQVVDQVRQVTSTVRRESENLVKELHAQPERVPDHEQLAAAIARANSEALARANAELKADLVQIVRKEVSQAIRDQSANMTAAVLRSAASTPAPTPQARLTEDSLREMLKAGFVLEAFQKALFAADVHFVEYLLRRVNVANVVSILDPATFLSLVQQLAASIDSKTDLKVEALQALISSTNLRDGFMKERFPSVAEVVKRCLNNYCHNHPESPKAGQIRLLLLAVDALLAQVGFRSVAAVNHAAES